MSSNQTHSRPSEAGTAEPGTGGDPPHGLNRRVLLRRAGIGAASVLVVGAGATGYRANDAGVFSVGDGPAYAPWQTWNDDPSTHGLIAAALLAPSPHNAQAWRFRVTRDRIDVFGDTTRRTGVTDPYDRELEVGLGAAAENIMLAAAARGRGAELVIGGGKDDPAHAATVGLSRARRRPSELHAAIPHRHSNRYAFSDRPLRATLLDPMRRLELDLAPAQLVILSRPADVRRVGELTVSATRAMVADAQRAHDDARWMRQSWDAIQHQRDGITLDAAGLSDWLVALAKILPAQSTKANDAAWLDGTRGRQVSTARAWGVVTVQDAADPRQRFLGGRLLERAHLWATVHGLALQHMNAITERADRERQLDLPRRFGPAFAELMPGPALQPLVSFRLGYPTRAGRPSPRRPVGWISV